MSANQKENRWQRALRALLGESAESDKSRSKGPYEAQIRALQAQVKRLEGFEARFEAAVARLEDPLKARIEAKVEQARSEVIAEVKAEPKKGKRAEVETTTITMPAQLPWVGIEARAGENEGLGPELSEAEIQAVKAAWREGDPVPPYFEYVQVKDFMRGDSFIKGRSFLRYVSLAARVQRSAINSRYKAWVEAEQPYQSPQSEPQEPVGPKRLTVQEMKALPTRGSEGLKARKTLFEQIEADIEGVRLSDISENGQTTEVNLAERLNLSVLGRRVHPEIKRGYAAEQAAEMLTQEELYLAMNPKGGRQPRYGNSAFTVLQGVKGMTFSPEKRRNALDLVRLRSQSQWGDLVRERRGKVEKLCIRCLAYRELLWFGVDNSRITGLSAECRLCTAVLHDRYTGVRGLKNQGQALIEATEAEATEAEATEAEAALGVEVETEEKGGTPAEASTFRGAASKGAAEPLAAPALGRGRGRSANGTARLGLREGRDAAAHKQAYNS